MSPLLFTDVRFGDDEAWQAFDMIHGITHQTTYQAMLAQNLIPMYLDMFGFPQKDNANYLLDHWQIHQSNARLLGLTIPDLSSVDLTDESQYQDWLKFHATVHLNENAALGI